MPTPVDYDPFANTPPGTPGGYTPVDTDPFSKPSIPQDMLKGAATGLKEGAAYLLGTPGDLENLWGRGVEGAAQWLGRKAGVFTPEQLAAQQAHPTSKERFNNSPTGNDFNDAQQKAFGQNYIPQTVPGQYARTVGNFAPGVIMPGGVEARAANVLLPALASETAGQVTKGTPYEGAARLGAALAGGLGASRVAGGGPVNTMLREDTRGVTDQQIALARQLAERSPVPLTGAEAVQQVTQGASGLGTRQRILEGTKRGREAFNPFMAQRPANVDMAARHLFDALSMPADPGMLATNAQQTAEGSLSRARQAVNAQAAPHYANLPGQTLPAQEYQAVAADPSFQAALGAIRNNPELNAPIAHLPDNDLSVLNEVQKQLGTMAENVRPSQIAPNPGANNRLAGLRDAAAGNISDSISNLISQGQLPPDWENARQTIAQGMQQRVEPMRAGPLGDIASSGDIKAQTGALYPNAPPEGMSNVQALNELGPYAAPLTRQHLANTFNEATQNLQSGPNQWGGAKFAAQVAGNPEQRRVLTEGVQAAAPQASGQLDNLIQALEATGKRQQPGSMTAFNNDEIKNLGTSGVTGETIRTIATLPRIASAIGEGFQKFQTNRNARALSELLLDDPQAFETALLRARNRHQGSSWAAALGGRPDESQR